MKLAETEAQKKEVSQDEALGEHLGKAALGGKKGGSSASRAQERRRQLKINRSKQRFSFNMNPKILTFVLISVVMIVFQSVCYLLLLPNTKILSNSIRLYTTFSEIDIFGHQMETYIVQLLLWNGTTRFGSYDARAYFDKYGKKLNQIYKSATEFDQLDLGGFQQNYSKIMNGDMCGTVLIGNFVECKAIMGGIAAQSYKVFLRSYNSFLMTVYQDWRSAGSLEASRQLLLDPKVKTMIAYLSVQLFGIVGDMSFSMFLPLTVFIKETLRVGQEELLIFIRVTSFFYLVVVLLVYLLVVRGLKKTFSHFWEALKLVPFDIVEDNLLLKVMLKKEYRRTGN